MTESEYKTLEYKIIESFYKDRRAKRSGLPYMRHIDQGLLLLKALGVSNDTRRAWCIHPIYQLGESFIPLMRGEFQDSRPLSCSARVVVLAMEYRAVANAYLTGDVYSEKIPQISPIPEVNQMLIADKIHNWRDARVYLFPHVTSEVSVPLDKYFAMWIRVLGVPSEERRRLEALLVEDDLKRAPCIER